MTLHKPSSNSTCSGLACADWSNTLDVGGLTVGGLGVCGGRCIEEAHSGLPLDRCCPHVSDIRITSRINPGGRLSRTSSGCLGERGLALRGPDVVGLRGVDGPGARDHLSMLGQLALDLDDLDVDLLDQHLRVLQNLVETLLLALQRLDDASLQGVDAPHALLGKLVHLATKVRVRILRERLAVLGDHVDAIVPLEVLVLELVEAARVVIDSCDDVLPVALVVIALRLELQDDHDRLVVREVPRRGLRRLGRVAHPLGRIARGRSCSCSDSAWRPTRVRVGSRDRLLHGCSGKSVKSFQACTAV